MADVDFTNAVIAINADNPIAGYYLGLYSKSGGSSERYGNSLSIYDAYGYSIGSATVNLITDRTQKFVVVIHGTFSTSGTEFYIFENYARKSFWKVSNVSFAANDTFSLQISGSIIPK